MVYFCIGSVPLLPRCPFPFPFTGGKPCSFFFFFFSLSLAEAVSHFLSSSFFLSLSLSLPLLPPFLLTCLPFACVFVFLSLFLLPPSSTTVLAGIWRRVGTGILLRRRLPRSLGWGFAPLTCLPLSFSVSVSLSLGRGSDLLPLRGASPGPTLARGCKPGRPG